MARRGGAEPAQDIRDEIRDLGPPPEPTSSSNTFADPLRSDTESAPSAPSRSAPLPPEGPPGTAPTPEGAGEAPYDARSEVNRLRAELHQRDQRDAYYQRELALRLAGAQQVAGAPSGQPQIDPTLQQGLDILQVTEDDLAQVFMGGEQGAQIVSRALQAVYLLAVNATEQRLINYYNQDQGNRAQQTQIANRAQQMHTAFWEAYPDLAPHEITVQHFAAQVAREQAESPRFDWESAQREVARRTMMHLQQQYNVSFASPAGGVPGAVPGSLPPPGPRPTLQSRLRPVVGEMGGGQSRMNGNASQRSALTSEILELGRR